MQQAIIKIIIFSLLFIALPTPRTATAAVLARPPSNLGLVGYWNFDEGAGTVAGDSSGNGNNGTITGATWTDGKRGKALSFDGVLGHVSIGTGNTYFPLQTFTICTWVKSPGLASGMSSNGIIGITYGLTFYLSNQGHFVTTIDNGIGADYVTISENLYDNKYHNLCLTFDGTQRHMYIDGILKDSRNQTWLGTTRWSFNEAVIGRNPNNWSVTKFNGSIDDVRIYNRALSSGEISRLYSSGQVTRKTVSNQGLVGYWSFDEGAGTVAGDSSGNGNNGTITGATWTDGKRGKALNFNGSSYVNSLSNLSIYQNSFSASVWFKTSSSADQKIVSNNTSFHQIQTLGGVMRICVNGCTAGTTYVNDGKWHFAVVVGDGSGIRLYLDGNSTPEISQSTSSNLMSGILSIGKVGNGGTSYYFNGSIDDVRIYNRALSAGEIQKLYEQSSATINSSQNNKMTDGLVGLWSFDGKDISGTTAYDRSGQGNNGTITGAKPTIGKIGQALEFDLNRHVSTNNNVGNFSNVGTVGVWVKTDRDYPSDNSNVAFKGIVSKTSSGSSSGLSYWIDWYGTNSTRQLRARIHDGVSSSGFYVENFDFKKDWVFMVLAWDGQEVKLYLDGILYGTTNQTVNAQILNTPFDIGRAFNSGTYSWQGDIDDVRIYNRALSAEEVKQLYLMGK